MGLFSSGGYHAAALDPRVSPSHPLSFVLLFPLPDLFQASPSLSPFYGLCAAEMDGDWVD